ncbi:hypothetical protein M9Y10_042892 [Tritrichomonas musculus]|uniref:C3H1-type domain-containing protein n=1 Tax=Tritrichomonas musculus TaxID=1915356 RepID=A0ABR2JY95_9EUKA
MWFFSPYLLHNLHFDFEPAIREIDENEERCHQQYIDMLPKEEQDKFQKKVCLHWIRTLCNKGDHCKFLHEYDRDKMPKCYFWLKFHSCSNFDCIFRHDTIEWQDEKCPFYVRGFCKHGNKCRRKHVLRDNICLNYLAGFCPDGPNCIFSHAKWVEDESQVFAKIHPDQNKEEDKNTEEQENENEKGNENQNDEDKEDDTALTADQILSV